MKHYYIILKHSDHLEILHEFDSESHVRALIYSRFWLIDNNHNPDETEYSLAVDIFPNLES